MFLAPNSSACTVHYKLISMLKVSSFFAQVIHVAICGYNLLMVVLPTQNHFKVDTPMKQ